jgi:hypothetical protein
MDHTALDKRHAELGISIPEGRSRGGQRKAPSEPLSLLQEKDGQGVLRLKKENKIRKNGVKGGSWIGRRGGRNGRRSLGHSQPT